MKVGYARIDITPQESVPMDGYGNSLARMSERVLDPLMATCIAFEDDTGRRALLATVDLIGLGNTFDTEIRPAVRAATGVAEDDVHASAIHTHAGPDLHQLKSPALVRYLDYLKRQMVEVSKQALADLETAELALATVMTKNMTFVRHYRLADGTYSGPNYGHPKLSPIVAHESEADGTMQLAKIARPGKKDVVICNFQVHQTDTGGQKKHELSADIAGAMRREMEERTGCLFAYFTGSCGNLNPVSSIPEENVVPKFDHVAHGKALTEYALSAQYAPARFGPIRSEKTVFEGKVNHDTDHLAPQAREIRDWYYATNDRDGATRLAREKYGFSSVYQATAILRRLDMPATRPIPISVMSVGDLAFAIASYEMFDTNAVAIRAASPFPMTMIIGLADHNNLAYLPTRQTFEHGSYASDTCSFGPGIGEDLQQAFLGLLKKLAGK